MTALRSCVVSPIATPGSRYNARSKAARREGVSPMLYYTRRPISLLSGLWGALVGVLVARVAPRPVPAALLSGMLASVWPHLAYRIYDSRSRLHEYPTYMRAATAYYRAFGPLLRIRYRDRIREHEELDREEERLQRERIGLYGFDPHVGPPPELRQLERVIAVGQVRSYPGGRLILSSIEAYREGCLLQVRILSDEDPTVPGQPGAEPLHGELPDLEIEASDDLGRRYPVLYRSGGGSEREVGYEFMIPRPLDPSAGELTVSVTTMRWEDVDVRRRRRAVVREVSGPWVFPIPL